MTDEELKQEIERINRLGREQMARLWRFSPPGHRYFKSPLAEHFKKRFFDELGGFSPEISKKIGWEGDKP